MTRERFTSAWPSDMHCHFRQGEMLQMVTPATASRFGYAIAMPNTTPPITTVDQCREYTKEITRAAGKKMETSHFKPLGVAYMTDSLDPDELRRGFEEHVWVAAKVYPKGATTNSDSGVTSIDKIYSKLEVMQEIGMPVLLHGEMVESGGYELARWDRESAYLQEILPRLRASFPKLKIVLEHVSTAKGIEIVQQDTTGFLAATITPHHALFTDSDVSSGGLSVHANCLPIIKGAQDRLAIQRAMVSGDPRFFAGTDSAPHDTEKKFGNCCSFGAYVAPGAIEAYAAVFEGHGAFRKDDGVERFSKFMSLNGPNFYGLNPSLGTVTMVRNTENWKVRERFVIPGKKILQPDTEVIALFHEDLGLAPDFPWVVESVR